MEGLFYIKHIGQMQSVQAQNGDVLEKVNVVLSTKECRVGESGVYAMDVDYAFNLLGERARNFMNNVKEGEYIVASLSVSTREHEGVYYSEFRLSRWAR